MTFKDLLIKWNKGISRGAPRRFAKAIGVEEVTVGRWANGKHLPEEEVRPLIAKALGISVDELNSALHEKASDFVVKEPSAFYKVVKLAEKYMDDTRTVTVEFSVEEWKDLKSRCEHDGRNPYETLKWLARLYGRGDLVPREETKQSQGLFQLAEKDATPHPKTGEPKIGQSRRKAG